MRSNSDTLREIEEERTRKAYLATPDSETEADDWSGAVEVIGVADDDVLDLIRSRSCEQEVLDILADL